MKLIGRIDITKQELLDIIFKRESITLDPQILDKFSKDKKACMATLDVLISEIKTQVLNNEKNEAFNQNLKNQQQQDKALFLRSFLVVLLLQLVAKKAAVRVEFAQYLIQLINSEIQLSSQNFIQNPWQVLELFSEEGAFSADIKKNSDKIEEFKGFPGITETEKKVILNNLEKIYIFAVALVELDNLQKIFNFSVISYAFYCESGSINSEYLQIFEKKSSFQRNVSIVASILSNLLTNSKMKKSNGSEEDTTWVELCGQSRYNMTQLLNFIVEELNVEDLEGLKLKGTFVRTQQTLNSLSLQVLGSISVQFDNTLKRIDSVDDTEKESYQKFVKEQLDVLGQKSQNYINALNFKQQQSTEVQLFCQQVPSILQLNTYTRILQDTVNLEIFKSLVYLNKKNSKQNEQKKPEDLKQKKDEGELSEKEKLKRAKALEKANEKKKLGFGLGTEQLFELFLKQVQFNDSDDITANFNQITEKFFNLNNKDLQALYLDLNSKTNEKRKVKVAKGAQDFGGKEMALRKQIFDTVTSVFRSHGAVEIDTPVFELKETLTGKYGEDSKLIYDLEDQGGELLSLRYDLTVPFARFMALQNKTSIKRYQMQKVYRRDQPNIKKGRFREFYQCDFDICGAGDSMMQDAEVISVFDTMLTKLKLDKFVIKINNRKILDAMIEISGAPMQKFKAICSAIDKLDKEPWSVVEKELIEDKGIDAKAVAILEKFVNGQYTGKPQDVLQKLIQDKTFEGSQKGEEALKEMGLLFQYLGSLNALDNSTFDLSLARGLDYYTGMIFEIILVGEQVGSIAGGGRYDELIGMFMEKKTAAPSVGGSLGIERVFRIMEARKEMKKFTETEVLVSSLGDLPSEKIKITGELWAAGIKAEYLYKNKDKSAKQMEYANQNNIPFMIFIGDDEVKANTVTIKNMYLRTQATISRDDYIKNLQEQIAQYHLDVKKDGIVTYYDDQQQQQEKK